MGRVSDAPPSMLGQDELWKAGGGRFANALDEFVPDVLAGEDFNFNAQKQNGNVRSWRAVRESDAVFFGGDDGVQIAPFAACHELGEFFFGEHVMVCETGGDVEGCAQGRELFFKAFWPCDT